MAFVNEYISDEDWKKYNIQAIEDAFKMGNSSDDSWTIDKENNIFLKKLASSRIDNDGGTWVYWAYALKRELYVITVETVATNRAKRGEDLWVYEKIKELKLWDSYKNLSEEKCKTIMPLIEEAFLAYGKGGVYSSSGGFELKLELDLN